MPKKPAIAKGHKELAELVIEALDDMKAERVVRLDVSHLTSITDTMIVATGRSDRHVRSIADGVVERCKKEGHRPIGVEGQESGEWVLVDLGDVIVHVMQARVRDFYGIEKLWDFAARDEAAGV